MRKVFISSVMRDFAEQRAAARTAVETLRQKPVMAEDFGAKPFSSQVTCMEGVRQSDIYLGILGPRYGYVTGAGISVTEEEFNEARRRGLPVLWFVQKGDREPEQQKFLDRIGAYAEGYFVDFYTTPQELQTKVTRSLYDHIGQPDVLNLDGDGAARHAAKYLKFQQHFPEHTTYLHGIIFPSRQGEPYLSPLDLGRVEFKGALMQRALFGTGAVLQPSLGTNTVEGQDHLAFVQKGTHQRLEGSIEIHCDGTLFLTSALGTTEGNRNLMAGGLSSYVVDQDETGDRLTAFLNFADAFYGTLEESALLSSFYAALLLRNMNYKSFGHRPKMPLNSMSIPTPMNAMPEPMIIPPNPLKVARAELTDSRALAAKFVALAERTFKTQNRYFSPRA